MTGGWKRNGDCEVYVLAQWRIIEHWKITTNEMNPSGNAIVWYGSKEDDAVVRVMPFVPLGQSLTLTLLPCISYVWRTCRHPFSLKCDAPECRS